MNARQAAMPMLPPIEPTPQQQAIVRARHRLLIVEANAGAAKTTTLALRVRAGLEAGVRPAQVLLLTYTAAGCEAALQALARVGLAAADVRRLRVATFEQFAAQRLQEIEGPVPTLRSALRVKPFVLRAIARAREQLRERHADAFHIGGDGALAVEGLLDEFQRIKGALLLPPADEAFRLSPGSATEIGLDFTTLAVLRAYEHLRRGPLAREDDRPEFRFDGDATYDLARLLEDDAGAIDPRAHPLALDARLVLVDEMHDMNRAMFTLLRGVLGANPAAALIGVGDRDQVIHSEAGADAAFMHAGFDREIGVAARLPLEASYRFGDAIAGLLQRHAKKPYASRAGRPGRVEVLAVENDAELARFIRAETRENATMAVLLRHPGRSIGLENELLDRGADYVAVGFASYLRRPEVLFVRGVLSFALDAFSFLEVERARRDVIAATLLFCGGSVLSSIDGLDEERLAQERADVARQASAENFQAWLMPALLEKADERVRNAVDAAVALAASDRIEDLAPALAALDVHAFAARLLVHAEAIRAVDESVNGLLRAAAGFESIRSFLRGTAERELRLEAMQGRRMPLGLRLSTIEAAKGLEFDHVVVPGVDERDFDGEAAAERNLFYVAASRARHRLTLTHRPGRPSGYLASTRLP